MPYFDAVLDKNYKPQFNGTAEETKKWLQKHKDDAEVKDSVVCLGKTVTITSVENYLKG